MYCGVQPLDHIVAADLDVDEVLKLLFVGGKQLVKARELARIAGLQADPAARCVDRRRCAG